MTKRPLRRLASKPALRVEEIDAVLERLRAEMGDVAEVFARTDQAGEDDDEGERKPRRRPQNVPDLRAVADAELRAWLVDETLALVEPEGSRGIDEHEFHHELLKKALVGLKREVLQRVATDRGLIPEPRLDDLARQVASSFSWDEAAIARLVLDYAEDPRETDGGPVTRVFTLSDPADIDYMTERLDYVEGRYYRTDIAKWFVFGQYKRSGSVLRINGTLQTYKASVDPVSEDKLSTAFDFADARIELHDGSRFVLVHDAKSHSAARSMLAALKVATLATTADLVPHAGTDAPIVPRTLHPSTLFLLDVITHRMRGHLFRQRNPILARFRLTHRPTPVAEPESSRRKPTLRAVRFEGENLLDSAAACGLMWNEGRPLADVTVEVAATVSETDGTVRDRVTIRLAVEKDAVLVSTSLISNSEIVAEVHRAVIRHVEAAMATGVSADREADLRRVIRGRAESDDPEADAQLLEDELSEEADKI